MGTASVSFNDFSFQVCAPFEEVIAKARIVRHRIGRHAKRSDSLIEKLWGMLIAVL